MCDCSLPLYMAVVGAVLCAGQISGASVDPVQLQQVEEVRGQTPVRYSGHGNMVHRVTVDLVHDESRGENVVQQVHAEGGHSGVLAKQVQKESKDKGSDDANLVKMVEGEKENKGSDEANLVKMVQVEKEKKESDDAKLMKMVRGEKENKGSDDVNSVEHVQRETKGKGNDNANQGKQVQGEPDGKESDDGDLVKHVHDESESKRDDGEDRVRQVRDQREDRVSENADQVQEESRDRKGDGGNQVVAQLMQDSDDGGQVHRIQEFSRGRDSGDPDLVQQAQDSSTLQQVECPEKEGVQTYPHPELCDQFYLCSNGTLTLERCQNGLLFKGGNGAAHHHCHYQWEVDCGKRAVELIPLPSDGCEYQFGLYAEAEGACSNRYIRCEFGRPQYVDCAPGLAFDETSHRCNWPDQLPHIGCVPEKLIGFHCPTDMPSDPLAARFWPFPRFAIEGDCEKLISCVNGHPRIVTCGEGMVVDDTTLTCEEPELVPNCYLGKRRK